jgi:hypothetical protein
MYTINRRLRPRIPLSRILPSPSLDPEPQLLVSRSRPSLLRQSATMRHRTPPWCSRSPPRRYVSVIGYMCIHIHIRQISSVAAFITLLLVDHRYVCMYACMSALLCIIFRPSATLYIYIYMYIYSYYEAQDTSVMFEIPTKTVRQNLCVCMCVCI